VTYRLDVREAGLWSEAARRTVALRRVAAGAVLHPASPNPFNPSTTIRFRLDAPATVTLSVYDLSGRLVRRLAGGGILAAGDHAVPWNGRDGSGRALASGTYFVERRVRGVGLAAAGAPLTRNIRVTLLT